MTKEQIQPSDEIILDAYPTLVEGEHFYNAQPPFDQIFAQVSERTGIPATVLQSGITSVARHRKSAWYGLSLEEKHAKVYKWDDKFLGQRISRRFKDQYESGAVVAAMRNVMNSLKRYVGWADYVVSQMDQAHYANDGTYQEHSSTFRPPMTYPEWRLDQQTREARLQAADVASVVKEAFPQDLAGEGLTEALSAGKGKVRNRYRIKVAMY